MAWFSGKVNLGNFADIAGAVNKFSESVKNIEKNFDTALGFEEKAGASSSEGLWPSATDRRALFEPVMAFMGNRGEESGAESLENAVESSTPSAAIHEDIEADKSSGSAIEQIASAEEVNEETMDSAVHPDPEERTSTAVAFQEETISAMAEEMSSGLAEETSVAEETSSASAEGTNANAADHADAEADLPPASIALSETNTVNNEESDPLEHLQQKESSEIGFPENSGLVEANSIIPVDQVEDNALVSPESLSVIESHASTGKQKTQEEVEEKVYPYQVEESSSDSLVGSGLERPVLESTTSIETEVPEENSNGHLPAAQKSDHNPTFVPDLTSHEDDTTSRAIEVTKRPSDYEIDTKEHLSSGSNLSAGVADAVIELEKVKKEMKMMETALQGAARQAQSKADEIAKLMNENEQLKAVIEDLRRKSSEAEVESLREEYHQRVAVIERKVYALTKERDTLRREQSKKSDAAALLKEKDEIINQVMAEGEELSKKQAAQESQIRKLRAQIREFEEEKKGLATKLQECLASEVGLLPLPTCLTEIAKGKVKKGPIVVQDWLLADSANSFEYARECARFSILCPLSKCHICGRKDIRAYANNFIKESTLSNLRPDGIADHPASHVEENKVESIKKDKAATEKLLQETIEKHQAELATQKEYYSNALNAAKEAEALAEARANSEARTELESRLREAEERETMLVQALDELRQTLSRKEQQAVFREDMLRRDIEDLQKRYQASERRCEELVTQVPESTRPLLRQIEAMQETTARRAEAWAAVERSLTSRLQ
ncbi:hypothetical protein RJ639_024493, partial [Escallonia herrerae]